MKKLTYLLPYEKQSVGIQRKVSAQIAVFQQRFKVESYGLIPDLNSRVSKIFINLFRELVLPISLLSSSVVYYRYSPKHILTSVWLFILSCPEFELVF